jgi:hypothetical protein
VKKGTKTTHKERNNRSKWVNDSREKQQTGAGNATHRAAHNMIVNNLSSMLVSWTSSPERSAANMRPPFTRMNPGTQKKRWAVEQSACKVTSLLDGSLQSFGETFVLSGCLTTSLKAPPPQSQTYSSPPSPPPSLPNKKKQQIEIVEVQDLLVWDSGTCPKKQMRCHLSTGRRLQILHDSEGEGGGGGV